jgi:hypothetical protein
MAIVHCCPRLEVLDARGCFLTEYTLMLLAGSCRSLTKVGLNNGYMLSDSSVIALASGCERLSTLHIGHCYAVSDHAICRLACLCGEYLLDLNLTCCYTLTNKSVYALCNHCPILQKLNMLGCFRITSLALLRIVRGLPGLTELRCSRYALLLGVKYLQWRRPGLKIAGHVGR